MYHSSPDFSVFAGEYQDFLKRHKEKYGEPPVAPFHGHAYDATLVVLNAIKKVAKKKGSNLMIDRKKLTKAMLKTKNLKGLTGNITCDKMGDCADPHIAVYQVGKKNVKDAQMPTKPTWKKY